MSEKSLRIRAKYASKILKKLEDLSESVTLLTKVDKQLLGKSIQSGGARLQNLSKIQRGGAGTIDLKEIQKQALISRVKLQEQRNALDVARKTITELNTNLAGIKDAISGLTELMEGLNFDIEPLGKADIPDLSHYQETLLYNAFHNVSWSELKALPAGKTFNQRLDVLPAANPTTASKEVRDSTNEASYEKLRSEVHGGPGGPAAPAGPAGPAGPTEPSGSSAPAPGSALTTTEEENTPK